MTSLVNLKPTAGFCIKSITLQTGSYTPTGPPRKPSSSLDLGKNIVAVPKGLKVFVNIAWDAHVPQPPAGSEEAIQRAMEGEEVDESNPDGWYVPVVVSEGREDRDKAGKPSLVFDCIFHSSVKSRTFRDPAFKIFLIELALQRIEAQTSILLSRDIGTPNIPSKGKLEPRTVSIPTALFPNSPGQASTSSTSSVTPKKVLIEELPSKDAKKADVPDNKGILKQGAASPSGPSESASPSEKVPRWNWKKDDPNIVITVQVPDLEHAHIKNCTLDLEPRRIILHIPSLYTLDVDLELTDAEITAQSPKNDNGAAADNAQSALTLKRARDLNVNNAQAEWRVADGILFITA